MSNPDRDLSATLDRLAEYGEPAGAELVLDRADLVLRGEEALEAVPPRRKRPPAWLIAPAAALAVFASFGVLALIPDSGEQVADTTVPPATTTAPPTTVVDPVTTLPPSASSSTTSTTTTTVPPMPASLEITWQQAPTQGAFGADAVLRSIVQGGPGLVAVGGMWAEDAEDYQAAVWTSIDGVDWERATGLDGFDDVLTDVTDGPAGLVAITEGGSLISDSAHPPLVVSADGTTWTRVTGNEDSFLQEDTIYAVTAGGPGYVAVGSRGDDAAAVAWTSADGAAWTSVEAPFGEGYPEGSFIFDVITTESGLVAVGGSVDADSSGSRPIGDLLLWTSSDGVDWSRMPLDSEQGGAIALGTDGDRIAVVGYLGNFLTAWVSEAGDPFVSHPIVASQYDYPFAVLFDGGRLLSVGGRFAGMSSAVAWASADGGVTWYEVSYIPRSADGSLLELGIDQRPGGFRAATQYGDMIVAVGATGNGSAPVWTGTWKE